MPMSNSYLLAKRSIGCSDMRLTCSSKPQLAPNLGGDVLGTGGDVNLDRVFGRLQRLELAVQEVRVHEVPLALRQPLGDQLLRAFQPDKLDVLGVLPAKVLLVGVLQRGAGQHDLLAASARLVDQPPQRLQPRSAIVVVKRD